MDERIAQLTGEIIGLASPSSIAGADLHARREAAVYAGGQLRSLSDMVSEFWRDAQ